MKIDISRFDANKRTVITWFHTKGGGDIKRTISMMAQITHVPCIAIAYWIGAETNWHPDALSSIRSLKDFYGYDEIVGKPDGAPE